MVPAIPLSDVRHFLLTLTSIILLLSVTPSLGDASRETWFDNFEMCSDTLTGTESISVYSEVHCAVTCAGRSSCTGFSYLEDGACNLHKADLISDSCDSSSDESTVHFVKQTVVSSVQCQNGGELINEGQACQCKDGYVGDVCERLMIDCTEGLLSGHYPNLNGIFRVLPSAASSSILVQCDNNVHHVILERWVANVTFNVTMDDYVTGFGNAGVDYWMGLENLHLITNNDFDYHLGIQLSNNSNAPIYQIYYSYFKVKGEEDLYSMTFTSDAPPGPQAIGLGDCLGPLKDLPFSTYDLDNDGNSSRNCAADYGGGWWYDTDCSPCNLMGELRWFSQTRVPGSVSEVFWLPGMDPQDFSPAAVSMFLFRD